MVEPNDLRAMSEQEKIELLSMLAQSEEGTTTSPDLYVALLHDSSPEVRKLAVQGLWDCAGVEHIGPLMEVAEHDVDAEVRARALSVLGIYIYEGSVQTSLPEVHFLCVRRYLLDVVRDAAMPLMSRRMALEALSFDPSDDIAELIEWAYHHEDEDVVLSAIFSMGRGLARRWAEHIVRELKSTNGRRRLEAITAASEGFVAEATPRLRALAMSRDKETRLAAIWALAHAGGPGALEVLELCAESADEEVREAAEEAVMEYVALREVDSEEQQAQSDNDDEA